MVFDQRCRTTMGKFVAKSFRLFSRRMKMQVWNDVYLHFKKGRTKRWPLVNDFKEGQFRFFSAFPRVFVVE